MTPRATYRVQFSAQFTLSDGARLVPYLARLGISHLYSSPLLQARRGSTHCYDVVDHSAINPELGGAEALEELVEALHAHGMGMLLDIVPNHMGVGGADNRLWLDVLEWGQASPYATWFDINWESNDPRLHGKILLPFLGTPYGIALEQGEIALRFDSEDGGLSAYYFNHRFPLAPATYRAVLAHDWTIAASFHAVLELLPRAEIESRAPASQSSRVTFGAVRKALRRAMLTSEAARAQMERALSHFDAKNDDGRGRLHTLLEQQNFRLAHWRAAADEINYRRFFDINDLAGFRVEVPAAFDESHALLLDLWRRGAIDGLRIDHVDGLADPRGYCRKLRRRMETLAPERPVTSSSRPWIVVEKILAKHERIPAAWRVDGTTGYDFMDDVGALLHDPAGEPALNRLYEDTFGGTAAFHGVEVTARRQILRDYLASELAAAAELAHRQLCRDSRTRDYTLTAVRRALSEIVAAFPVYRIYTGETGPGREDVRMLDWALSVARRQVRAIEHPLLNELRSILLGERIRASRIGAERAAALLAVRRFQQLTGPVAAKSVEDTGFYRYGRLLSRNEVGSNPGQFSIRPATFRREQVRRGSMPLGLLATATHDHKRGEDVRARLAVLSEAHEAWSGTVIRWSRLNAVLRGEVDGEPAPSRVDEYQLYQMLVGAWPLTIESTDRQAVQAFAQRVEAWLRKVMREAKMRSEWAVPNQAYEQAAIGFLHAILDPARPGRFVDELAQLAQNLGPAAATKGLTQLAIKCWSIGIPDIYQGTERWDLSLVDPDNRRPVDFAGLEGALSGNGEGTVDLAGWKEGHIKQQVMARLLDVRRLRPELFLKGHYERVRIVGGYGEWFVAQAVIRDNQGVLLVVPVRCAGIVQAERPALLAGAMLARTSLVVPAVLAGMTARSVLDDTHVLLHDRVSLARLATSGVPMIAMTIDR